MPKIIRILRSRCMKIFSKFSTVNISKLNFWRVICIAKNFIWTTLNMISQYLDFFASSDSRFSNSCISDKYCPNHTSMEIIFSFQMMSGFVLQGHTWENYFIVNVKVMHYTLVVTWKSSDYITCVTASNVSIFHVSAHFMSLSYQGFVLLSNQLSTTSHVIEPPAVCGSIQYLIKPDHIKEAVNNTSNSYQFVSN